MEPRIEPRAARVLHDTMRSYVVDGAPDSRVSTRIERTIAVIGAGISGLACARVLAGRGRHVVVLDKGRAPGGRMSTRRQDGRAFDHGAQHFTARGHAFVHEVDSWRRAGIAAEWDARVRVLERGSVRLCASSPKRHVGVPGMDAVPRYLARGLDVRCEVAITELEPAGSAWRLVSSTGERLGPFDEVVVALPAPQAAALLSAAAPALAARASRAPMQPCWAAMVELTEPLDVGFDAAFVHASPLAWVARESSKPGRAAGERWLLHASGEWSARNLERDPEVVARTMLAAFESALATTGLRTIHLVAHRWRYALAELGPRVAAPYLRDDSIGVSACGDWCGEPRVEGAWTSGAALGAQLCLRA